MFNPRRLRGRLLSTQSTAEVRKEYIYKTLRLLCVFLRVLCGLFSYTGQKFRAENEEPSLR